MANAMLVADPNNEKHQTQRAKGNGTRGNFVSEEEAVLENGFSE